MSLAPALKPNIDPTVEEETVTFDFGLALNGNVSISVDEILCIAIVGTDASAGSRLIGDPTVVASPTTGGFNQAVLQLVGTMLAGVTYQLQCVVTTSDGQTLSLRVNWTCATPPGS